MTFQVTLSSIKICNCCCLSQSQTDSTEKSRNQDKLQRDALRDLNIFSSTTGMSQCCLRWLNRENLPDPLLNCSFLCPAVNPPLWFTPWIASVGEGFLFDPHFILLHFTMPSHWKRRWLCAEEQGLFHCTKHEEHQCRPQIPLGASHWLWFVREEGSIHWVTSADLLPQGNTTH